MTQLTKIEELKKQLQAELGKQDADTGVILSLSNEIAKLDEREVRFSVDAGIINRLGKELVGRSETAVSELVKNAYDADATEVELIFENAFAEGGALHIIDNGLGMTREQLIYGFMRLSSTSKIHEPTSPGFKRQRAGQKGIGRFATQRLGRSLVITTQTADSLDALKVTIDWDKFEMDLDLSSISNRIEVVPKLKEQGTELLIHNLREAWSDAEIRRIYRYTSDLLQPFPLSKAQKEKSRAQKEVDLGFRSAYFRSDHEGNIWPIVSDEIAFFDHALAEIEGYVDREGKGYWSLSSKKLEFENEIFPLDPSHSDQSGNSEWNFIKGAHFKCYYFIYEPSLLSKQISSFIREVAKERGGIRLYRNGFRVLPYGEPGNDWITLDESMRKRGILGAHGNINVFGFVEVNGETANLFEETSSREGVIENDAFKELVDFVYRSITTAAIKVAGLRGRKGKAGQRNWEKPKGTFSDVVDSAIQNISSIVHKVQSQVLQNDDGGTASEILERVVRQLDEAKSTIEQLLDARSQESGERAQLVEELNMMRILASIGLVIGEFVHEVKQFFPGFDAEIKYLLSITQDIAGANPRISRLEANFRSFSSYAAYFETAISRNVLRELEPIDLRDVVREFCKVIQPDVMRMGGTIEQLIFEGYDLVTIPMHPSEWTSILFNFYTNAKKAILRKRLIAKIKIRCGRHKEMVFLEFSDNGDGIDPRREEDIFEAFYTTASAPGRNDPNYDSLTGMGLGLKIVRDIVESYGGNVYVAKPEQGYSTTMRVEIPEFKDTEK